MNIKNWKETYDVVVAGGGFSGVAAAVAAAREGKKVALIEQYGCLGGAAVTMLVNPFMPYASRRMDNHDYLDFDDPSAAGIFKEILERLDEKEGLFTNKLTFHEEILKIVLDEMVSEAGIKVLFHCFTVDVERTDDVVTGIIVASKEGLLRIEGKVFIDSTGDADVTTLAGCPVKVGNEEGLAQPATTCFRLMNVDTTKYTPKWNWSNCDYTADPVSIGQKIDEMFYAEVKAGNIHNPYDGVSTHPNMLPGVVHFNSTRVRGVYPMNVDTMSAAEMEGRRQCFELYHFMRDKVEGFENSHIMNMGIQIGIRESRHIISDTTITEEDIMGCTKYEDSIARGMYGIDIHSTKEGDKNGGKVYEIENGNYYTIPYSSLIPQTVKNLIVAGRPISSTHLAHGAHRIIPICTCIGEAAGYAAALAADSDCNYRNVPIGSIHDKLDANGALY